MTSPSLENGTERCNEVLQKIGGKWDVVVNIQGDEPFIEGSHVDTVASVVMDSQAVMGTLARPHIDEADVTGVNNVKVVLDVNGYALYFSRAVIPHNKKGTYDPNTKYWRKLGIYSYRASFLPDYIRMPESALQQSEDLEQNKVRDAHLDPRCLMRRSLPWNCFPSPWRSPCVTYESSSRPRLFRPNPNPEPLTALHHDR